MRIFNFVKASITDWATGNSQSYEKEINIYDELIDLISRTDQILDEIIAKGNFSDEWAVFKIKNDKYTLPFLNAYINDLMKNYTLNSDNYEEKIKQFEYINQLQEIYEKTEFKIKTLLVNNVLRYEEMDELYWNLIEIKKLLISNMNLTAIQKSGFRPQEQLPKYEDINHLKILIAERKSDIIPYLGKINNSKKK